MDLLPPTLNFLLQYSAATTKVVVDEFEGRTSQVMSRDKMKLTKAGQAEILRAAQRDGFFKELLGENASELLRLTSSIPTWIRYKEVVKLVSGITYEILTTMLNLQTLGEEFTGIIQVNRCGTSLPNKHFQFLMILLNNCGKKLFVDTLQKYEKKVKISSKNHFAQSTIEVLSLFRILFPLFERCHKMLFYFNGDYYELTKRLFGIRYVLVRYWLKNNLSVPTFRLLGIISLISILFHLLLTVENLKNMESDNSKPLIANSINKSAKSNDKCPLCLNHRQDTSVTPCGHIFCWSCIISWLQEQPRCPLCRQSVKPSRVVFLQNYSKGN